MLVGLDSKIITFLPKKYSELIKSKNVEELIGLDVVVDKIVENDGRHNVFLSFSKN